MAQLQYVFFTFLRLALLIAEAVVSLALIYLTIFRWKRTDLFIQTTEWSFLLGILLEITVGINIYLSGHHTKLDNMLTAFGIDLIFAGHLIIALQYFYTSLIMPKILLESEINIKLEIDDGTLTSTSSINTETTANFALNKHVFDMETFKRKCWYVLCLFGVNLWIALTCFNMYFASKYWEDYQ